MRTGESVATKVQSSPLLCKADALEVGVSEMFMSGGEELWMAITEGGSFIMGADEASESSLLVAVWLMMVRSSPLLSQCKSLEMGVSGVSMLGGEESWMTITEGGSFVMGADETGKSL